MLHVSQSKAPALFVGHGNPMNAIGDNLFIASLNNLSKTLQKPKAVLVISAHWSAPYNAVSVHESELLYDMYGFSMKEHSKEHFIPLLYIAGASKNDEKSRFVYEGIEHGSLSMRSWITGE